MLFWLKLSPYDVMLILCLFSLNKQYKKQLNIKITQYSGELFFSQLSEIKFKIWRVTFSKGFFTTEKFWDGIPVFRK